MNVDTGEFLALRGEIDELRARADAMDQELKPSMERLAHLIAAQYANGALGPVLSLITGEGRGGGRHVRPRLAAVPAEDTCSPSSGWPPPSSPRPVSPRPLTLD